MDQQQRGDEHADGHDAPGGLQAGEPIVEAGDHHEADAVEQRGEGEHRAVGAAGDEAHDDVGAQQQAHEDGDEQSDARRDLGVRAERGDRVGGAGDERGHHQQREFGVRRRWANGE